MDQATQQNAALVEEMAAAASSLKGQANELVQAVAVFKLGQEQAAPMKAISRPMPSSPNKAAAPTTLAKPAAKTTLPPASKPASVKSAEPAGDWESF
jgi:hypothetical protein